MLNFARWNRFLSAAFALVATAPYTLAGRGAATAASDVADRPPAGDPELGLIIIVGIVGFLILVAWVFSRVGDDNASRGTDRTLL